jgi:WHG domain-containing protein
VGSPPEGPSADPTERADQLLSEALVAAAEEHPDDPRDALRAMGHAFRAFAVGHRDLYASLLPPEPPPQGQADVTGVGAEPVARAAALLGQLGVPDDRQIHLLRTYAALLHGFAMFELSGGFGSVDVDESFEMALDEILAVVDAHTRA